MKSENEIPRFDLADQILAGQRKFNAAKRIAPRAKNSRVKTQDQRPNTTDEPCHHERDSRPQPTVQNTPVQESSTKYTIHDTNFPDKIIPE